MIATQVSVADLVIAAKAGSQDAHAQLYVRFRPTVLRHAWRRLGNAEEAYDLTQDVFTQVLRNISQLRDPMLFDHWLSAMTKRMTINRKMRCLSARTRGHTRLKLTNIVRETPLSLLLEKEHKRQIRLRLRRLRLKYRQILKAFYLDDKSYLEISAKFGIAIGTVKSRLHKARKCLAVELEDFQEAA